MNLILNRIIEAYRAFYAKAAERMAPVTDTSIIPEGTYEAFQDNAKKLLLHGSGGTSGRPITDPVNQDICMGLHQVSKKQGWPYSSCAYGMLWLYESLGVPDVKLHRTGKADNPLTRVAHHELSEPVSGKVGLGLLECGDVIQIGSNGDSHIMAVYENPLGEPNAETSMLFASWGLAHPVDSRIIQREVKQRGLLWYVGERPLRRVLRLRSVWERFFNVE